MARQEKLWLVFFGEGIAERHQWCSRTLLHVRFASYVLDC